MGQVCDPIVFLEPLTNSTMGSSFYSPAYDTDGDLSRFGDNELNAIQQIWQRVAKDFSPFDVNVTLQEPPADWLAYQVHHQGRPRPV